MAQSYVVIEIFTGEGAQTRGKSVSDAVLMYVRKLKIPARTIVLKGTEGCYENGEVATRKIVDLSANQPVKIEIVLPEAEADPIINDLQEIVSDGILGTRPLKVASHRTQKRLFPSQTRVRDVMTPDPATVTLNDPAGQVMKALLTNTFTGLPVVDSQHRPVGIVSQSDLIARAGMPLRISLMTHSDQERIQSIVESMAEKTAEDIMTQPAITINESEPLTHAVHSMVKNKVKRLPVMNDDGLLTGIVSRLDIFQTVTSVAPAWEKLKSHAVRVEHSHFVSDIMRRDTHTVSPDTPVNKVLSIIDDNDIQRAAVVDKEGHLLGLISDRMLLTAFSAREPRIWEVLSKLSPFSAGSGHGDGRYERLEDQTVEMIMQTDLVTIGENASIDKAISLMTQHALKRLPVVDENGIFKGMISREALLKTSFSAMEHLMPSNETH